MRSHRAVVLVSLDQAKVRKSDRRTLERRVVGMAKALRGVRGVRQIEGVLFATWKSGSKTTARAPWKPHGALLFVEARNQERLRENIKKIFEVAGEFDQEEMVMEPLGDLDSF